MYISDKIVSHGDIIKMGKIVGQFVVISNKDYPAEPGMRRTTYGAMSNAKEYAAGNDFTYSCPPESDHTFVGVELEKLREFRPSWCITKDELLAQYEVMQRDGRDGPGPIKNLDLRKDPELLKKAKELWAERLTSLTSAET